MSPFRVGKNFTVLSSRPFNWSTVSAGSFAATKAATPETNGAAITFVLGAQDDVVNPQDTFTYLGGVLSHPQNYSIHMHYDLKHRIPYHVFEEEVNFFLNNPK